MPTEEQNHSQYVQAIRNTFIKSRKEMEKDKSIIYLNKNFKVGVDKKATHRWNK